ncbi:MAG: alpha/beta fold hydrolase [Lacunisphaera sp.]|jgi:cephalosporin-C deacetylase|nr:alpha/beta fold hydrolase [Lacunisphaera sp.]
MPLIDKPLAELKTYPGLNPRPADFDAYWDAALRELDATDPQPELVPSQELAPQHSEVFDLWFTGVGGARVYAKYVRPKNSSGQNPAVLQFHGYTGHSGDFFPRLAWSGEGFCVAALDCRGQGGRSEDSGQVRGTTNRGHIIRGLDDPDARKLYYRQVYLDTAQLARVVMAFPEVDAARVGAMGMSQGGALTLACAALEPRIKRAAPMFPFLCDYRRVWEMDLAKDAYEELRTWFRQFDPRHERENEIFTKLGYIDCQHLAPRIRAEVLMFTCLMDPICPPSTQFAAYNKLTAKKDMVIYPDYGHEIYLPGESDRTFNFLRGL